jgi:hypothetical protein
MEKPKNMSGTKQKKRETIGGREFGNVIEPTQAQMASENKGLAADFGKSGAKKPMRKKGAA